MTEYAVWAPRPSRVELALDARDVPMSRDAHGWWRAEHEVVPGTRYGFRLDGGNPLPDPRSRRQPDGVEAVSAVYDDSSFRWTDAGWAGFTLDGNVLYELHIGTFSPAGTFDGAIERLDHLVALGVDAIEVMPVAAASGAHGWGYDGVDLFAVHEPYGGPDGLKRFVDAAHAAGLAVIIDVVYNHLGPIGNHLAAFGPYFTDRYETPWGDAVNYDGDGSEEVRRFVLDNVELWLRRFHADGLRLDAIHAIVDHSSKHIVTEIVDRVRALEHELGRSLVVIAESEGACADLVQPPPRGHGLDAVWFDDWHHALHALLTGERAGYYADFGTVDDLARALAGRTPPGRFVIAAQNHDQVGNRARGERLSMLVGDPELRLVASLLLTTPFVPMLFQGEEWGASTPFLYFSDHADPAIAKAVRDGRRAEFAEFGWAPEDVPDPQAPSSFERSVLDWDELDKDHHASLLRWYRQLIAFRRAKVQSDG